MYAEQGSSLLVMLRVSLWFISNRWGSRFICTNCKESVRGPTDDPGEKVWMSDPAARFSTFVIMAVVRKVCYGFLYYRHVLHGLTMYIIIIIMTLFIRHDLRISHVWSGYDPPSLILVHLHLHLFHLPFEEEVSWVSECGLVCLLILNLKCTQSRENWIQISW